MSNINHFSCSGFITKDAKKLINKDNSFTFSFSIALNQYRKINNEFIPNTTFLPASFYSKKDISIKKGDYLLLEGRIDTFTSKDDQRVVFLQVAKLLPLQPPVKTENLETKLDPMEKSVIDDNADPF